MCFARASDLVKDLSHSIGEQEKKVVTESDTWYIAVKRLLTGVRT